MKRSLSVLLALILSLLLMTGCGNKKYKLNFGSSGFESKKTKYSAGEEVTVYYDIIATDTDYSFWLDDEDIELKREYDDMHVYVFKFTMPDHDVTMYMKSVNSMEYIPYVSVLFSNDVEKADIWIMLQTEESLKSSLWGTPTIEGLDKGEAETVSVGTGFMGGKYIIRIIDDEHALYAANDIFIEDGYSLSFKSEESKFDTVIEVYDRDGNLTNSAEVFEGVMGAK